MLTELLSELELRRKDRELDFWTVARKLAAGETLTTAAIERLLAESGKSPSELKAAVELMTQRACWREQRRSAADMEKEQTVLQERIATEDRKLAEAERVHEDATARLIARLDEIRIAVSEASDARRRLIETCPDAGLRNELAAITDRLTELRARAAALRSRGELVKQAERAEDAADRLATGLVPGAPTARIDGMRSRAARDRKAGREAQAALPAVQREIAKLEREEREVRERMTRP